MVRGRFNNFTARDGLSDNTVNALYEDSEHNLWIGTESGGLDRFRQGRFTSYTSRRGLFSDEIFDILEDDDGWLWMTCSQGIFRVRARELDGLDKGERETIPSVAYGKSDGMESPQCNGAAKPAAWKGRDGRFWFATSKGLVVVNPRTVPVNVVPPPVYIQQVLADRKPVQSPESKVPSQGASSPTLDPGLRTQDFGLWTLDSGLRTFIVPPGRGELEFSYTALEFQAPESTRFKYKLEGVDSDWIDAGNRRTAHYNNVAPGKYQFRVVACNKDGVWNEAGATMPVELEPHLWQTRWLRGSLALAVIAGAGGAARYVTKKRMQRKLEALERRHAIERERGRIAKDIHDDLGSSLTRIMMLGERAQEGLGNSEDVGPHVHKIVTSARRTVQALDEIVWAVNPENDTLEGLVEYISHFADEFFADTSVNCRLEIPAQLPPLSLPAEVRHDLFLAVKEAFNNVLKHARASSVRIGVTARRSLIEIVISDDGCGFDPGEITPGRKGNGLGNMRKRIERLGGRLDLFTAPEQGTRIKLTAKLNGALRNPNDE